MPSSETWMTPMLEALPLGFDFYHLGRIELESRSTGALPAGEFELPDLAGQQGIGFRLEGEARGVLLLLVGEGLDLSMYSEVGNVIASRLAAGLSAGRGLEVTISPPQPLSRHQLRTLLGGQSVSARIYLHRQGSHVVPLQVVLLPATAPVFSPLSAAGSTSAAPEAIGNA